ncbi:hypothetical protein Taro_026121 [Colocasia esculenta]|uniref:Uncharacterized protein n=1 Tax=Colocasia esculenta TaxID=4460 RepID=A0A843VJN0_COLES|nr:hypothetical protein [Colocasia esculenta]
MESNKRDAKLYANMFARMQKDTDVALKRLKVEKDQDEREATGFQAMDTGNAAVAASFSLPAVDEMVVDSSGG